MGGRKRPAKVGEKKYDFLENVFLQSPADEVLEG